MLEEFKRDYESRLNDCVWRAHEIAGNNFNFEREFICSQAEYELLKVVSKEFVDTLAMTTVKTYLETQMQER